MQLLTRSWIRCIVAIQPDRSSSIRMIHQIIFGIIDLHCSQSGIHRCIDNAQTIMLIQGSA